MARPSSGRRKICQCEICTATKPQGVEQPSATHAAHARDQRLRDQLLRPHSSRPNDVTTLQSTSSIPPPIDINLPNDTPSSAAGQDTNAGEHAANASSPPVDISDIIREARLEEVEEEINLRLSTLNDSQARLEFRTTPSEQKSFAFPDPESILRVNYGQFALNTLNPHNRRFIEIEGRLCSLLRETQMAPPDGYSATRRLIEDALYAGLERLHVFKQRAWQSQSSDETSRYIVDNSKYHHFTMQPQLMKVGRYFRAWVRQDPTIASVLLGALVCYIQFQIPIRRMRFILACHRSVMRSLARRQTVRTVLGADILSRIPRDIHTVLSRYELDPTSRTFLSCPTCFALYPLSDEALNSNEEAYEANNPFSSCSVKSHPDSKECGTALWTIRRIGNGTYVVPVRKQIFQDLKEWVGRILAIPGIEDLLTEHQRRSPSSDRETDFWDSPMFHNFKGPDGKPFMEAQPGPTGTADLRLLMSLGVDSFSPFHMKVGHHNAPSTAMYMVLLVLPEHLRYRREYMYMVTLMSGNPSKHEINHPLKILVDQLLDFWEGVFYTRTAGHPLGRQVLLALILVVCDSEAAHQVSGFGSHSATYFCWRCMLTKDDLQVNLDPDTWPRRELDEHRAQALRWLNASSESERADLFKGNAVRYTELLRLPYFNPITQTTIDNMHMALLGLVETHITEVLKVDHKNIGGEGRPVIVPGKKAKSRPSNSVLRLLWNEIRENEATLPRKLKEHSKGTILYLCLELELRTVGKKEVLIAGILEWVSTQTRILNSY